MTVIFGECLNGRVFLAADTRRRDHITGQPSVRDKLHKLSNSVVVAQGGAGSGAADEMVLILKSMDNPTLEQVVETCRREGPSILAIATDEWLKKGMTIPPTFIVVASVDPEGAGTITSIDLATGASKDFKEAFISGTHTQQAILVLSEHRSNATAFDALAVNSVLQLQREFPDNISMPVDVAVVEKHGLEFTSCINRLGASYFADDRFRY